MPTALVLLEANAEKEVMFPDGSRSKPWYDGKLRDHSPTIDPLSLIPKGSVTPKSPTSNEIKLPSASRK